MKIVNGKKFYAADIKAARRIDGNGWDRYNGQNWQWYSLFYNPASRSTNRTIAHLILWRICLQAARLCRKA